MGAKDGACGAAGVWTGLESREKGAEAGSVRQGAERGQGTIDRQRFVRRLGFLCKPTGLGFHHFVCPDSWGTLDAFVSLLFVICWHLQTVFLRAAVVTVQLIARRARPQKTEAPTHTEDTVQHRFPS